MRRRNYHRLLVVTLGLSIPLLAVPADSTAPWMNAALGADQRAELLLREMSFDERVSLLHGLMALPFGGLSVPKGAIGSAGFVAGIARLGVPALQETDAGLGVADPVGLHLDVGATAMPSTLLTAATFSTELAAQGGAMIGNEAWSKGFNVMLAGGVNLTREPRGGRNFEYFGEDPLLAGLMAGAAITGIQSQHVISTTKHFALNAQESQRQTLNAVIDEQALRESDLLAFEIAIERGQPGSVMCAYNAVNGNGSCNSDALLNQILKRDWGYKGWVMSDWGAVYGVDSARNGLDQQSAAQLDEKAWFDEPLKQAVHDGQLPAVRVSDMARRILRSMFAVGLFENPPEPTRLDYEAHAAVSQRAAEAGIVLLKNENHLLPISGKTARIAVIGGKADLGVWSGAGSSQVLPAATERAIRFRASGEGPVPGNKELTGILRMQTLHPSAPLQAIRALAPNSVVSFDSGEYPESAAALAHSAEVAIVFASQWMLEFYDVPSLRLPGGQDELIRAVIAANPRTIVVLETGGPVLMPWLDQAAAVIEAWYPGIRGGEAIANVLFGVVNPSGHLPITFPAGTANLPQAEVVGINLPIGNSVTVDYNSAGSDVGYRWYARQGTEPLFPFGFGLSYTTFSYGKLEVRGGQTLTMSFDVTNTGSRSGADVPQAYLTSAAGSRVLRLIGFNRLELAPGETRRVTMVADRRLLGAFDTARHGWNLRDGEYTIGVGSSATMLTLQGSAKLRAQRLKP
jgi:beta-glucosidase